MAAVRLKCPVTTSPLRCWLLLDQHPLWLLTHPPSPGRPCQQSPNPAPRPPLTVVHILPHHPVNYQQLLFFVFLNIREYETDTLLSVKQLNSEEFPVVLKIPLCVFSLPHSSAYSAPGTPPASRPSFVGVTPRDPGGLYQAQVSRVVNFEIEPCLGTTQSPVDWTSVALLESLIM